MNFMPWAAVLHNWTSVVFVVLLPLLFVLESRRPRSAVPGGWLRRGRNLALIALSTIGLRLAFPLGAAGFAAIWQSGLFHVLRAPAAVEAAASLVALDMAIYWQHRAFHHWPLLWRAHRVHHSDLGVDATLGVRFHPFEIFPSFGYKLLVVALLGVAPPVVAAYEASLLGFSLLTHANVVLPPGLERVLRRVLVTPDWHRVHHSVRYDEANSNFGNILSVWDRWFGTARERPHVDLAVMPLGLPDFRDPPAQRLGALLVQPFVSVPGASRPFEEAPHA